MNEFSILLEQYKKQLADMTVERNLYLAKYAILKIKFDELKQKMEEGAKDGD